MNKKNQTNPDELGKIVASSVKEAIESNNSAVKDARIRAQNAFEGKVTIGHEEGRSKVVATKCRDAVRQVKPSLLGVFLASATPVEFIPKAPKDVQIAEQATKFVKWKFDQQNGYRILSNGFHDALVKKVGIAKVFWEETEEQSIHVSEELDDATFSVLGSDPDVEFVEHSFDEETGLHDVKVSMTKKKGDMRIISIAPEDFFIDDGATSIDDFTVCGHETEMPIADLVAMGIPQADVEDLASRDDDEETNMRHTDSDITTDPLMRKVMVAEAYMRADVEGTGKPQLYSFLLGGQAYKILHKQPVKRAPFAVFEVDPEPHGFYGRSLVDIIIDDQDAATAMLRGLLDNVAMVNNPGCTVVESQVNMDDVLNTEIGPVRRAKQAGAIEWDNNSFVGAAIMPALQYYDATIENKTGVSRASLGLDPDALQNATATAVNATVNGANGQVEVMARNLAEGVKQLFRLMLELISEHMTDGATMQQGGDFKEVNPSEFDPTMDMLVNVGLGSGQEDAKMMVLNQTLQTQQAIWQAFGANNGLVTLTGIRNTLADMLALGGLHNADRYYNPMTPDIERQMAQQAAEAAQNQPPQQNPDIDALMQVEQMKAQGRQQEAQTKAQIEIEKAKQKDDLERDKMLQDGVLKVADLVGKYGVGPDLVALARQQNNN